MDVNGRPITTQPAGSGASLSPKRGAGGVYQADDTHVQDVAAAARAASSKPASAGPRAAADLGGDTAPGEAPADETPPVVLSIDKATNSIIVSAGKADMDTIESLIRQISKAQTADVEAKFQWYKVQRADPQQVASLLERLFTKQGQPQPQPQAQQQPQPQPPQEGENPNPPGGQRRPAQPARRGARRQSPGGSAPAAASAGAGADHHRGGRRADALHHRPRQAGGTGPDRPHHRAA